MSDSPKSSANNRVLVTGASGFVGRPLCKALLADGHQVWAMSRRERSDHDLADGLDGVSYQSVGDRFPADLLEWAPTTIVNLAWSGIPDYGSECSIANLDDQVRLVDQVVAVGSVSRVVGAGTCLEYGGHVGQCSENEEREPTTYLAWAKQSLRRYLLLAASGPNIDVVWFRIFFAYGPGQRSEGLLPSVLKEAAAGRQPVLANPDAARDFVYIDDVVEAFRRAVNPASPPGTFNIGSGLLVSLDDLRNAAVETAEGVSEGGAIIAPVSHEERDSEMYASLERVSGSFGWVPQVPLREGIRRTWHAMNVAGPQSRSEDAVSGE